MAAFTSADPEDRKAFDAHWARIRGDAEVTVRTIVEGQRVLGHVASFWRGEDREVTYWVGREYWGRGVATAALRRLLVLEPTRPLLARVDLRALAKWEDRLGC